MQNMFIFMKIAVKNLSQQLALFFGFQIILVLLSFGLSWILPAQFKWIGFALFLLLLLASMVVFYDWLHRNIVFSLKELNLFSQSLAQGNAERPLQLQGTEETEQLSLYLNDLNTKLQEATEFINQIGEGNFEADMQQGQQKDRFTTALLSMRDKLKTLSDEEDQRTWINQHIAKFNEILRIQTATFNELAQKITSELVKLLQIQQGFLFIYQDEQENDTFLELRAAYAYDRRKFMKKRLEIGEGLVGQVYLERQTTYLRTVSPEYLQIVSASIEAKPTALLIVPLIANNEVQAIIELASFQEIPAYQIEFVEKIGESIAVTISNLKVNERTKLLLENSQKHSEELQSREEELRQNMEEMQATQEEITRQQSITEGLINNSTDVIVIVDNDLRVVLVNEKVRQNYALNGVEVKPGMNVLDLIAPDEREHQLELYKTALSGENFMDYTHFQLENIDIYFEVNYFPLRREDGKIIGSCSVARDITARKAQENALLEANKALESNQKAILIKQQELEAQNKKLSSTEQILKKAIEKARQAETELRDRNAQITAQEEELRQNLEEMESIQEQLKASERQLFQILSRVPAGVFVIDAQGKPYFANDTAKEMLGKGIMPEEKDNLAKVYQAKLAGTDEDYPVTQMPIVNALGGKSTTVENMEIIKDNGRILLEVSAGPVYDDNKQITYAVAIFQDITEKKRKEQEIKEAHEELQASQEELRQNLEELYATQEASAKQQIINQSLIDSSENIILVTDIHQNILLFNQKAAHYYHNKATELKIGLPILQLYPAEQRTMHEERLKKVLQGERFKLEEVLQSNGKTNNYEINYFPLKAADDKIEGVCIITTILD